MKIRYYGHVGQRTGYGHAANHLCLALQRAGAELEIRPLAPPDHVNLGGSTLPLARCLRKDADLTAPDAVIVHTLPLDCKRVIEIAAQQASQSGVMRQRDPVTVAYTTWEAIYAPDDVIAGFPGFDALWAPSKAALRALGGPMRNASLESSNGLREARVVPHCFDEETLAMRRDLSESLERPFTFYYVGAWNGRKNVPGVIHAYVNAFTAKDRVRLVILSPDTNQRHFMAVVHGMGIETTDLPAILFNNTYVSDEELMRFVRDDVDCFVSATHGEAWNLPAFEAMLAGRHIIVPDGQGSDEYLDGTSADTYGSRQTFAELDVAITPGPKDRPDMYGLSVVGAQGLTSRCRWHDPDLLELADRMRLVYDTKERHIDHLNHYNPIERYGYAAVAKQALGYLECLR